MTTECVAWPEVRIGSLGTVFTGRTPPTERLEYFGEDFPFVTPTDMHQGKYIRKTQRYVSSKGAELLSRIAIPANSVCVSCIGWQMGEVVMTGGQSFTNQQINTIVPSPDVNPSFLYYSLLPRKQELLSLGAATGVRTPILNKSVFCELKVKLPDISVQKRIADVLSAYDNLIENNQQRIRVLEEMVRTLYRGWFIHENYPAKKETLGSRPCTLADLCQLVKKPFDERRDAERPLLDLARIPQKSMAPMDTGKANDLSTSRILFEAGDTLFGAIRCYLHKVVAVHYPGITNTSVFVLRPKKPSFRSLVAVIASDAETVRWAETHSTGTKMPVINGTVFQTMPIPPMFDTLAEQFEKIAGPMLDHIGLLSTQIQTLRQPRDLLPPRLLSGQISLEEV